MTLTTNILKSIRLEEKVSNIICSAAFSLSTDVICGCLLSTFTAAGGRKKQCENFDRSTMTSYNLKTRSNNRKRASLSHSKMISLHNIKILRIWLWNCALQVSRRFFLVFLYKGHCCDLDLDPIIFLFSII